jgi:hypothetical protein
MLDCCWVTEYRSSRRTSTSCLAWGYPGGSRCMCSAVMCSSRQWNNRHKPASFYAEKWIKQPICLPIHFTTIYMETLHGRVVCEWVNKGSLIRMSPFAASNRIPRNEKEAHLKLFKLRSRILTHNLPVAARRDFFHQPLSSRGSVIQFLF